jgi:hypothetical protein
VNPSGRSTPRLTQSARRCSLPPWAIRFSLAALFATSISLAFTAAPALAEVTHLYDAATSSAIGFGGVIGVAVNQSDGSVYAAQLESGAIRKFTSSGAPDTSYGGGTGGISVPFSPWEIAVDQSSHDLYVPDPAGTVYKFDSEGNPVTSFGTAGQISASSPIGIAVDPTNGNIYVASSGGSKVEVFTSSGSLVREFSTDKVTVPVGIAVDGSGRVYVDGGGYFGGSGVLERFDESGTSEGVIQTCAFQDVTVDPANEDIYTSTEGELTQYAPGGESPIDTFGVGFLNENFGVAVNETSGEVYAGGFYSGVVAFGPLVTLANVTTDPPSAVDVGHTVATLTGTIDPAGGPSVTGCDIEYGTTTEYSSGTIPCETASPINTPTEVSAKLAGLSADTTYHYRFVAHNKNGASYGQDQTVEPPAVLGVATDAPTGISAEEATLNGSFQTDSEGGETHYYFEWGLSKEYGNKTPEHSNPPNGTFQVSEALNNLSFYTLYHYRIVTTDHLGTSYGPDQSFYTDPPTIPRIDASGSSSEEPESAVLEAEVDPHFGATVVRFEYGPSTEYGFKSPPSESIGQDGVDHRTSSLITGLQPGVTYHFRVLAINFAGVVSGPDQTFDTTDIPAIEGTTATTTSPTTATLSGQVKPGFSPTTLHFEYGTSSSYGQTTPESASIGSDNSAHPASASITGLAPATTYHYRIVATNGVGTVDGPDQTFTAPAPEEERRPPAPSCKRNRILRHGKCVKKPKRQAKHHKRAADHPGGKK